MINPKRTRTILKQAQARAIANRKTGVELEDVLYALMRAPKGVVAKVMKKLGLCNQLAMVTTVSQETVMEITKKGTNDIPLTVYVLGMLDNARSLVTAMDDDKLQPYHLLVATVTDNSIAGNNIRAILHRCGKSPQQVVSAVWQFARGENKAPAVSSIQGFLNKQANVINHVDDPMQAIKALTQDLMDKLPSQPSTRVTEIHSEVTRTHTINPAIVKGMRWDEMYTQVVTASLAHGGDLDAAKIADAATQIADGLVAGIEAQFASIPSGEELANEDTPTSIKDPAFAVGDSVVTIEDWQNAGLFDIPEFTVSSRHHDEEANVWMYTITSTDQTPEVVKTIVQDELVEKSFADVQQKERMNLAAKTQEDSAKQVVEVDPRTAPSESPVIESEVSQWVTVLTGGAVGTMVYVLPDGAFEVTAELEQSRVTAQRSREVDNQGTLEHEYQVNNGDVWWPSARIRTVATKAPNQLATANAGDGSVVG